MPDPAQSQVPNSLSGVTFAPSGAAQASATMSNAPDSTTQTPSDKGATPPSVPVTPPQVPASLAGVTFDSSQQTQQTPTPPSDDASQRTGIGEAADTSGLSSVAAIPGQIADMGKRIVQRPVDLLTQAVELSNSGDWKGALETASQLVNSASDLGIDHDNPLYKAAEQLIMHPINAIGDSYKQSRKAGESPAQATFSTIDSTLSGAPTDTEVNVLGDRLSADRGDLSSQAGDLAGGILNSHAANSIPVVGPQIAQVGQKIDEDLHAHNYSAAIGAALGPLLTLGAGKLLGMFGEGAEAEGSVMSKTQAGQSGTPGGVLPDSTGVPPPPNSTGVPAPPKPGMLGRLQSKIQGAAPTTTNIAGVKVPQASDSVFAQRASSLASKQAAKDFVAQKVQPAARAALQSNFAKSALNDVDDLRSAQGAPNTSRVPPKTPLFNLDNTAKFLKDEAQVTYKKLDTAAANDIAEWREQMQEAKEQDQLETDRQLAEHQLNPNSEASTPPQPVTTAQDALGPEPKKFTELQDQLRRADRTIKSTNPSISQVDREAAIRNYPRFQREMDQFIAKHEDTVNEGELDAADKVRAKATRYGWIANKIRTATKGLGAGADAGATGNDVKINATTLDSIPSQFDNEYGAGSFDELLGPGGRANYNAVIKALQVPETGGRLLSWLKKAPFDLGEFLVSLPSQAIVDNMLFNPNFGKTALEGFNRMKQAHATIANVAKSAARGGVASAPAAIAGQQAPQQQQPDYSAAQGALSGNPKQGSNVTTPSNPTYDSGDSAGQPVPGLVQQGNIDVNHRPGIKNDDGSVSSIFSMTIPVDKQGKPWTGKYEDAPQYALVPSIANGKFLTPNGKIPPLADREDSELNPAQRKEKQKQLDALTDAATDYYAKTRQHLGMFSSGDAADRYAGETHAYVNDGTSKKVYTPSPKVEGKRTLKKLTSLDPAAPATDNSTAVAADKALTQTPQEVQDATSTIPVKVTQGQQMGDPNGRSSTAQVAANVDQGAGNNTIEVNNPKAVTPATMAHEAVHVWQNNLPPSVQAKIPDDDKTMKAFDISDVSDLRKQGKTLADLPREKAATIVQKYTEAKPGSATRQKLQPWLDDMQKTPLSSTMPTEPSATRLNMKPRPPQRPDKSVAGAQ